MGSRPSGSRAGFDASLMTRVRPCSAHPVAAATPRARTPARSKATIVGRWRAPATVMSSATTAPTRSMPAITAPMAWTPEVEPEDRAGEEQQHRVASAYAAHPEPDDDETEDDAVGLGLEGVELVGERHASRRRARCRSARSRTGSRAAASRTPRRCRAARARCGTRTAARRWSRGERCRGTSPRRC